MALKSVQEAVEDMVAASSLSTIGLDSEADFRWGNHKKRSHIFRAEPTEDGTYASLCGFHVGKVPDGDGDPPHCGRCLQRWSAKGKPDISGQQSAQFYPEPEETEDAEEDDMEDFGEVLEVVGDTTSVPAQGIQLSGGLDNLGPVIHSLMRGGDSNAQRSTQQGNTSRQEAEGEQATTASQAQEVTINIYGPVYINGLPTGGQR